MKEIMSALITPFTKSAEIDYDALARLIKQQLEDGIDGLIVCGTTAEVATLTKEEKLAILDFVIERNYLDVPIYYGCGSNCTATAISNCHDVEHKHIAGVLLVTPYYNRPSQEGIYQHFMAIAKSTSLPIMLYNIPSRTGVELEACTLLRLLHDCDTIVALKHATKNNDMIQDVLKHHPTFRVYSGEDGYFVEGFQAGMCGMISVMSHIVLKQLKQFIQDDYRNQETLHNLYECASYVFLDASPSPLKYIMSKQERCVNMLRLPLVPISGELQQHIDQWLTESDILL